MLAEGPNGTVFGGARAIGRVYAISEEGGQRRVRTLAQGLNNPNGVAVRDGDLYVTSLPSTACSVTTASKASWTIRGSPWS